MQGRGQGRGKGNVNANVTFGCGTNQGRAQGKGVGRGRDKVEDLVCIHYGYKKHIVDMCWDLHGKPMTQGELILMQQSQVLLKERKPTPYQLLLQHLMRLLPQVNLCNYPKLILMLSFRECLILRDSSTASTTFAQTSLPFAFHVSTASDS